MPHLPRKDSPFTMFEASVASPGERILVKRNVIDNWTNLANAFGRTWPTQDRQTRILTHYFVRAVR